MKHTDSMFDKVAAAACIVVLGAVGCVAEQFECDDNKPCSESGEVCVYYLDSSDKIAATACVKQFEVFGVKDTAFNFQDKVPIKFANSFAFGLNPVSIVEYEYCVDKKECKAIPQEGIDPECNAYNANADPEQAINCITWAEANKYCEFAQGRLCSEVEWEYAMGQLQEPAGTVLEWVEDDWDEDISSMPKDGTARTDGSASNGVVRGVINMANGAAGDPWMQRNSKARHARDTVVGFRCCSDVPITK
ncbi:MAG TPA: SUMF1/EgtB/PvdO family nonheme iron enzyme [Myxococcota bacterium]|nr:SUMF1/EgtB/PvdO family nonheme iron enzyme [Myxococcota bacterium]HOH76694.1 SUMF1/EgtB/PvdO family nonheme iron enzyme [Myxococcota bacterium]